MALNNITDTAYAGLQIAQAGMLITSQNVTGSTVDGFTRRNANAVMDALAPNSLQLNGTSFAVEGFTRQYSALIGSQLLSQQAKSSYSDTLVKYTSGIDSLVSDQNTGLTGSLSTFFNVMGTYAADPTSTESAAAITAAANDVASRMTGMTTIVNQLLSSSKSGLADTIKQVNTLLPELAGINQQITNSTSPGNSSPSADLLDERDRILTNLQKLVGGQSLINSDGTATQLVNGMPLVERGVANTLLANNDQSAISIKFNSKDGIGNNNLQTLGVLNGGQAGALLTIVDKFVPQIKQRLNSIAAGLVSVANGATQMGGPGSASKVPIFGFKVGSSVFSSLQQNSTDPTGSIPRITSDQDLTSLYNSLRNVITSPLLAAPQKIIGSYSVVNSIVADTAKAAPNSYTFSSSGNQLTITPAPINGISGQPQTVTVANGVLGQSQAIHFDQYGITINIDNPISYVNSGVIGLNAGKIFANQTLNSISATQDANGSSTPVGNYQIVSTDVLGNALVPEGTVQLIEPDGTTRSNAITLSAGVIGGQILDFGNGIKLELSDNGAQDSPATIAQSLNGSAFNVTIHNGMPISGSSGVVDAVSVSSTAAPGTYIFSNDGNGSLTLSTTINGNLTSQTIAISDIAANTSGLLNFNSLGIKLAIHNADNSVLTASAIASGLSGLTPTNELNIAPGLDTGLDIASSIASIKNSDGKSFSISSEPNVGFAYGLTADNFVSIAPSDPLSYMNGTTPYISSSAANSVSKMNGVFASAVANLVTDVGNQVGTWTNTQKSDAAVLNNLNSQFNAVSGVNLDEEAANLMKYQQLYAASSKVLQSGNQMFSALLAIMN